MELNTITRISKTPAEIIQCFFSEHDLQESHDLLWSLLKFAFSGNIDELSPIERANLFSFYQNVHMLMVAAYHLEITVNKN